MIIFLLFITTFSWLCAGAMPTSAGPLTDPTVIHTAVFGIHARSSCSDMRSLYDILCSCFFTIAACVYRAVHPNILDLELRVRERLKVTLKITFWALMTPELIILWALKQWFGARDMAVMMNEVIEKRKPSPGFKWTQTHGQFLQMGGFARKDNKQGLPSMELFRLLDEGFIDIGDLRLPEKEIHDKSKGDVLSKAVVVFQTTWFIFECIARLRQGLPLLEVEVVTLAFATLNAVTYGLWWYKPLNVVYPIYIPIRTEPLPVPTDTEASSSEDDTAAPTHEEKPVASAVWGGVVAVFSAVVNVVTKPVVEDIEDFGWFLTAVKWLLKPITFPPYAIWISIMHLIPAIAGFFVGDKPFEEDSDKDDRNLILLLSAFVGMIFGGVHFLSWDASFPMHTELVLWRASSIALVIQPFLVFLLALCRTVCNIHDSEGHLHSWICNIAEFGRTTLTVLSVSVGTVGYILARFCVLVIALLTLHNLPPAAFTNVSWTFYISHF